MTEIQPWSERLRFVQLKINIRLHTGIIISRDLYLIIIESYTKYSTSITFSGIGRTPYEAVFGIKPQLGVISTKLTIDAGSILETEEQLGQILNSEQLYKQP